MNKIVCICPTLNRPELLGRAIKCFENQTYEDRFLIIVDDLGQYHNQCGDRWQLVSFPARILSLGEKNNVCTALGLRDTWAYAKWDDDDTYMPWHLEATAEALTRGEFVQPRYAVDFWDGKWVVTETFSRKDKSHFCYHGCWSYTRNLFTRVGGYRNLYAGDDGEFQNRLLKLGIKSVGFDPKYKPSYWYNRPLQHRISEVGGDDHAYWSMGQEFEFVGNVPEWKGEKVWEYEIPELVIPRLW
jgi:hypothetical protein